MKDQSKSLNGIQGKGYWSTNNSGNASAMVGTVKWLRSTLKSIARGNITFRGSIARYAIYYTLDGDDYKEMGDFVNGKWEVETEMA